MCFNDSMETVLVNGFHSSSPGPCGIAIFDRHLRAALLPYDVELRETNLLAAMKLVRTQTSLVHYVPSAYANTKSSRALMSLMSSKERDERIVVVLHGLHSRGEDRFRSDTICQDQERHISLFLAKADTIVALSGSVAKALRSWQDWLGGRPRLLRLDHPGLFEMARLNENRAFYAFLGGISRSKKNHSTDEIGDLVGLCGRRGIEVWQHWTNVHESQVQTRAWSQSFGPVSDLRWSSLVSGAQVVLCPYQTRIQSVSGIVSEALSAQRFVLATSFELAIEMQQRFPALVRIEDNLQRWPDLILQLSSSRARPHASVITWDSFAKHLAQELSDPAVRSVAIDAKQMIGHPQRLRLSGGAQDINSQACDPTLTTETSNQLRCA